MRLAIILMVIMVMSTAAFANSVSGYSDFVHVKGGSFLMGSPESENWRSDDELQHEVTNLSWR